MGHQGIAVNDMCEEDKIEGLHRDFPLPLSCTLLYILYMFLSHTFSV